MTDQAAITIRRPREEVERAWAAQGPKGATPTFKDAPGDHGTEIYLQVQPPKLLGRLRASAGLAQAKTDLRRFKQQVETGEVARSDGTDNSGSWLRKLVQRPANPGRQR